MNATARPPTPGHLDPVESPYEPRLGETVKDTEHGRIGKVMGFEGPYVQLRPIEGGREWDADPRMLALVSPAEALSPLVDTVNRRSRGAL